MPLGGAASLMARSTNHPVVNPACKTAAGVATHRADNRSMAIEREQPPIWQHRYSSKMSDFGEQVLAATMIQSKWRAHLTRRRYLQRLQHFRDNEVAIVRLQAAWKG